MKSITVNVPLQLDLPDDKLDTVLDAIANINQGLSRDGEYFYNAQILSNGIDSSDITDEGNSFDTDELGEETFDFEGKTYPAREVYIDDEVQLISVQSLSDALLDDKDDLPKNKEAEYIDNQIFFYVDDADLSLPHDELVAKIQESL